MIEEPKNQDVVMEKPKGKAVKGLWLGLIGSALLGSFYLLASQPSADYSMDRNAVQLSTLSRGDLVRDVVSTGRIIASNAPQLYSPEQGFVSLKVNAGDTVEMGQVVAEVESPELQNQLRQQESELARLESDLARQELDVRRQRLILDRQADLAKVDLEAAEREERRAKISIKDHLISQIDLEEALDELARARVNHKHALEEIKITADTLAFELETTKETVARQALVVEELQRKINNLEIKASVSGVVGNVLVQPMALVAQNEPLMTLVDLSAYEAELNVAESYAGELGIGMHVELKIGANTIMGTLASVSPEVVNREVTARVRFPQDGVTSIRQNQQLSARILLENKDNVLKVRRGSFMQAGGAIAYRLNGDVAERVDIRIGATSMREVEVLDGLNEGDQIIISSYEEFNQAPAVLLR